MIASEALKCWCCWESMCKHLSMPRTWMRREAAILPWPELWPGMRSPTPPWSWYINDCSHTWCSRGFLIWMEAWRPVDRLRRWLQDNMVTSLHIVCQNYVHFFFTGDFTFIHVLSKLLLPLCDRHVVIVYFWCALIALNKLSRGVGLSKVTL